MQEAGTVLHLARSGRLILKANLPAIHEGAILVDEKGRRTGKVLELIGPVSSPYLSVQPFTDRVERIVGSKLFLCEDEGRSLGHRRYSPGDRRIRYGPREKYQKSTSVSTSSRTDRLSKRS